MSKLGKELIAGMGDAIAIAKGEKKPRRVYTAPVEVPRTVDVASLRRKLGVTQVEFAARYGFSPANVRNWEQGHRTPDSATRVYLKVIERRPDAVDDALAHLRALPAPEMIPVQRRAVTRGTRADKK